MGDYRAAFVFIRFHQFFLFCALAINGELMGLGNNRQEFTDYHRFRRRLIPCPFGMISQVLPIRRSGAVRSGHRLSERGGGVKCAALAPYPSTRLNQPTIWEWKMRLQNDPGLNICQRFTNVGHVVMACAKFPGGPKPSIQNRGSVVSIHLPPSPSPTAKRGHGFPLFMHCIPFPSPEKGQQDIKIHAPRAHIFRHHLDISSAAGRCNLLQMNDKQVLAISLETDKHMRSIKILQSLLDFAKQYVYTAP